MDLFRQSDEVETLEPVFCRGCDADNIRSECPDLSGDLFCVELQDIGRHYLDFMSFLFEGRGDIEKAERRHGRSSGPSFGEVASGGNEELYFHPS
jgi:hypothetical protein